jgi:hypothetical protein
MMYPSTVEEVVMTDDFILHEDLETFAQYLGVDYEDYYELYLGIVQDEEDESLVAV